MAATSKASAALDALATDLSTAIRQVVRRLRAEANPSELSLSQLGALARLEQGPMTTADLARAESMKPQSMGSVLASLEEEGLIERHPHPTDRRQIHVALTRKGAAVRTTQRAAKHDWLVAALATLDAADRKMLATAIPLIRQIGES